LQIDERYGHGGLFSFPFEGDYCSAVSWFEVASRARLEVEVKIPLSAETEIMGPEIKDPEPEASGAEAALQPLALCGQLEAGSLEALFGRWGLKVRWVEASEPIPGSYWGDVEAGLRGGTLFVRADTPVHSALHEGCHWIAMDAQRRHRLDTDAGGEDLEESAVCYLQIRLAQELPGIGSERLCRDMDAWGYSFRLGSTAAWFREDADDARRWLIDSGLLTAGGQPTYRPC
jgi:hypothetical protein